MKEMRRKTIKQKQELSTSLFSISRQRCLDVVVKDLRAAFHPETPNLTGVCVADVASFPSLGPVRPHIPTASLAFSFPFCGKLPRNEYGTSSGSRERLLKCSQSFRKDEAAS